MKKWMMIFFVGLASIVYSQQQRSFTRNELMRMPQLGGVVVTHPFGRPTTYIKNGFLIGEPVAVSMPDTFSLVIFSPVMVLPRFLPGKIRPIRLRRKGCGAESTKLILTGGMRAKYGSSQDYEHTSNFSWSGNSKMTIYTNGQIYMGD